MGNTTNDQDLWVLKDKVQPSVVGKDLTLESICASGICLRQISCIYSSRLHYMVTYCLANSPSTAISQSLWATTGTTLKHRREELLSTWLRSTLAINILSYCAQVILWYRKYSVLFKLLVHISMKNLTKMHKFLICDKIQA